MSVTAVVPRSCRAVGSYSWPGHNSTYVASFATGSATYCYCFGAARTASGPTACDCPTLAYATIATVATSHNYGLSLGSRHSGSKRPTVCSRESCPFATRPNCTPRKGASVFCCCRTLTGTSRSTLTKWQAFGNSLRRHWSAFLSTDDSPYAL